MLPVTEGLLIAALGTHLVLLYCWFLLFGVCAESQMDCDKLIDKLMSVADPQGAGAGLAKGAPPAATPAAMLEEEERCKNAANGSLRLRREAKPGSMDWWSTGKHSPLIKSTLWITPKIEKMYARYEARLGAVMAKTLGSAALQLYMGTVAMFLPIENQPGLIATSRATCLSSTRLAVLPASSTTATACSLHRLPLH